MADPMRRRRPAGPGARGAAAFALMLSGFLMFCTVPGPSARAGDDPSGPIAVSVDIRPGLCPNHIRLESSLAVPIAILGAVDFELDLVDPASVRLSREGVAAEIEPVGWTYEDVGTPLVGGLCACHLLRGDGLDDLEFYFSIADIAASLDLMGFAGEIVPLRVTGRLTTGEAIEGVDCALIILGQWGDDTLGEEVGMLAYAEEPPATETDVTRYRFSYYTTVTERVTIAIYDARGRVVARLNDMDMAPGIYSATWNGLDHNRDRAPAGIYFARVSNSTTSDTRKIVVSR
jgi:hypothetical protein